MSPDVRAIRWAVRLLSPLPLHVRRAALVYLWDRLVLHPPEAQKPGTKEESDG